MEASSSSRSWSTCHSVGVLVAVLACAGCGPAAAAESLTPTAALVDPDAGRDAAQPELPSLLIPFSEEALSPIPWPLPAPTPEQVDEARFCDIEGLVWERYTERLGDGGLAAMYSPTSACDLAALVSAYGWRRAANAPPPPEGVAVALQLLRLNPAFGLHNQIVTYYAEERLLQAPPFAALPVVRVDLRYFWSGLGGGMSRTVVVTDGDTRPVVVCRDDGEPTECSRRIDIVQALGTAATNLLPTGRPLPTIVICTDDYPDWNVTVTYADLA